MDTIRKINICAAAAAASVMLLPSCSKWTEPESLDYGGNGVVTTGSEEYLSALRAFKQTSHKVTIVDMDATAGQPYARNQHIMAMPDSADYICVRNAEEGLSSTIASEIPQVRQQKGTFVICDVDYSKMSTAWQTMEDNKEDGETPATEEEFVSYITENTRLQLDVCDKYGFDGIMISYSGTRSGNGTAGQNAYMEQINQWRSSHKDHVMIFSGQTLNVIDRTLFNDCDYIIIPMGTLYSSGEFTRTLGSYCRFLEDDVKQRIIVEVNVPSEDFPQQEGAEPQPVVAAQWTLEPDDEYGRAGICIDNIQEDYLVTGTFSVARRAITIMNSQVLQ